MVTDVCPPNVTALAVDRSTVAPELSVGFATWTFVIVTAWFPNAFDSCSRRDEAEMLAWTVCRTVVFAANDWPEACGETPHAAVQPGDEMAIMTVPTPSVPPCGNQPKSGVHTAMTAG